MVAKIAIFGSADPNLKEKHINQAYKLGEIIGKAFGNKVELLTGACIGLPQTVSSIAKKGGTRIRGYSGETSLEAHNKNPNYVNPSDLDELIFLEEKDRQLNGFTNRSLNMIKDAQALIYLGGRTGTATEYFAAYDEAPQKPMYVLLGAGGISDRIKWLGIKKLRIGKIFKTLSAFDLAVELDNDFNISDFQNDPNNFIVEPIGPLSWTQFAYDHPGRRKVIFKD